MKKIIPVITCLFLLSGCMGSHIKNMKLNSKQHDYWVNAQKTPLTFTVKKEKSDQAWSRAMEFINRFAPTYIESSTKYSVITKNKSDMTNLVYSVTRTLQDEKVRFNVKCSAQGGAAINSERKNAENNAHLLAYYMKTGKLMPGLVAKHSMD